MIPINGVELIYTEHVDMLAAKIIWWAVVVVGIIGLISLLFYCIQETNKDVDIILHLGAGIVACGLLLLITYSNTLPYTSYYVLLDDDVSWTELDNAYGLDNIYYMDNRFYKDQNFYKIVIPDERSKNE